MGVERSETAPVVGGTGVAGCGERREDENERERELNERRKSSGGWLGLRDWYADWALIVERKA